jgi:hypothetical protein
MSIELTEQQQRALDAESGTLTVIDPRTNETYVLLRAEIYQRFQTMLSDDFNAEDAFQAQIESAAQAGWNDPSMDVYNELDPRRQP